MKNHNNVLTYKFNTTLMAEIEMLRAELLARFRAGKAPEQLLINHMRSLSQHGGSYKKLKYENAKPADLDFGQLLQVLGRKYFAFEHGKNISRGKAYAKKQRELQSLNAVRD